MNRSVLGRTEWWSLPQNARTAHTLASSAMKFFSHFIIIHFNLSHLKIIYGFVLFCSFSLILFFVRDQTDTRAKQQVTSEICCGVYYHIIHFFYSANCRGVHFQCVLRLQCGCERERNRYSIQYTQSLLVVAAAIVIINFRSKRNLRVEKTDWVKCAATSSAVQFLIVLPWFAA